MGQGEEPGYQKELGIENLSIERSKLRRFGHPFQLIGPRTHWRDYVFHLACIGTPQEPPGGEAGGHGCGEGHHHHKLYFNLDPDKPGLHYTDYTKITILSQEQKNPSSSDAFTSL